MSNDVVKCCWSGGKDSTCAVLMHLSLGHVVKVVCYIPMFTHDIPLIQKSHYNHILSCADRFRSMGAEVFLVSGLSYFDYVTRIAKKGKHKGKILGWPYIGRGRCGFKRDSKLIALANVNVGLYDYEDIGIAADELDRMSTLCENKRSILVDLGITEKVAAEICIEYGMYSPQYATSSRDGCVLCPEVKDSELEQWFLDYPQVISILSDLQETVKRERPDRDPPRRSYKWFL